MDHILLLLALMTCTGILGGTINHFISDQSSGNKSILKCIIIGMGASFLVPLFLNMISSSLIKDSHTQPELLLVIVGFCLVASISSKSFISNISVRLLRELEVVKEKYEQIKESEDIVAGEDYEELNEYEESSNEDPITILKQNVDKMEKGDRKTLWQIFGNSTKWKEISPGARRGVGRRFYNQVKSGEISELKPDGRTKYGSQYYKKI